MIKKHFRNSVVAVGVLVLVVGGFFLIKTFISPSVEGNVYYLEHGDFSVFFPDQPGYSLDPQELTPGHRVDAHNYTLRIGDFNGSLGAGYIKNPFASSNLTPEENLQRELEHTTSTGGSRLISSKLTTYKGYPAIDYTAYNQLDPSLPAVYVVGRDILKDGDLYTLGYGYPKDEEDKKLKERFLNSLTFGKARNSVDDVAAGNTFYTKSDNTNIRECASTSCKVVANYSAGTSVFLPYASESDLPEWVEVSWQDVDGSTEKGYVNKTTLERKAISDVYQASENTTASGTFCNGTYWDKCPSGQDFTCPANGGEAYCQSAQGTSDIVKKNDLPTIVKEWSPSVALLVCTFNSTGDIGFGSGYLTVLGNSIVVLTNKHVVSDTRGYAADSCSVQIPGDGGNYYTIYPGQTEETTLFKASTVYDWGYLIVTNGSAYFNNVAGKGLPVCQNTLETGDNILILGYPSYAGNFTNPTATQGIISGYDNSYYTTSAKIEKGNSGGVAIQPERNCYAGIPSAVRFGTYENLGRILNANTVFQLGY